MEGLVKSLRGAYRAVQAVIHCKHTLEGPRGMPRALAIGSTAPKTNLKTATCKNARTREAKVLALGKSLGGIWRRLQAELIGSYRM